MTWFQVIIKALAIIISLNDTLYVRIHRCSCRKAGARLDQNKWGRWYVYCPNPKGCKRRAADAKTKRRAKMNWNEEIAKC